MQNYLFYLSHLTHLAYPAQIVLFKDVNKRADRLG